MQTIMDIPTGTHTASLVPYKKSLLLIAIDNTTYKIAKPKLYTQSIPVRASITIHHATKSGTLTVLNELRELTQPESAVILASLSTTSTVQPTQLYTNSSEEVTVTATTNQRGTTIIWFTRTTSTTEYCLTEQVFLSNYTQKKLAWYDNIPLTGILAVNIHTNFVTTILPPCNGDNYRPATQADINPLIWNDDAQ